MLWRACCETLVIRILVAETSPAVRIALLQLLDQDPEVAVVAKALSGREALAMTMRHRPDLVLLGPALCIEGDFNTCREIMIEAPTPIVLLRQAGEIAPTRQEAPDLCGGAVAELALPAAGGTAGQRPTDAFLSKLKAMAAVKVVRQWRLPLQPAALLPPADAPRHVRIVAIAASTGGPAALRQILAKLPTDLPVPILIVQHVASGFDQNIAAWLSSVSSLPVKLAEGGERLNPGTVYLAPDDQHLCLASKSRLLLDNGPPVDGFRPSATRLFRSVAHHFGGSALALILSGMGRDGVAGLHDIRQAGGLVIAQDEASCVVFGMPAEAIREGVADKVLALGDIAAQIVRLTRQDLGGAESG